MKISDLFEDKPVPSKRDYYATVDKLYSTRAKTGLKALGGGVYSHVYDLPKETNSVLKVARHPRNRPDKDGYVKYLEHIVGLDNPYFPVVDELKHFVSDDGMNHMTVKLEKLHPIHKLSYEDVQSVFSRIFQRPLEQQELKQITNQLILPTTQKSYETKGELWSHALATFLENAISDRATFDKIQDPQLQEAIIELKRIYKMNYELDIHNENIMCRRTPYGIQLVFTDPFQEQRRMKGDS